MKKVVRRSHIRESFRANLLQEQVTADDVADVLIPGVSAVRNFSKGNWLGGIADLGLDAASIAAGAFTGGAGYVGARAGISALKAGTKVAAKMGKAVANPAVALTKKVLRKKSVKGTSGIPNTGKGKKGPWDQAIANAKSGKPAAKPKKPGGKGAGTAAGIGAIAGGMLGGGGGGSGGTTDRDIMGKDRPQTGFRNAYQGIDPFRSGEMRTSAGYYDTPVGRRQLYKGAGGGLVAPPSSMYENKVYTQLQEMVNKSIATREINNVLVTQDMAKNIVQLHEALNTQNKKLLEENIQSKDGFFEVLDFSVRN